MFIAVLCENFAFLVWVSSNILSWFSTFCQLLFSIFLYSFFKAFPNNGEGGIWTHAPLLTTYSLSRGAPSASLGTSPNTAKSNRYMEPPSDNKSGCFERRRWDSNPRPLAESLVFKTSSLNHSDISPCYIFYKFPWPFMCRFPTGRTIALRSVFK